MKIQNYTKEDSITYFVKEINKIVEKTNPYDDPYDEIWDIYAVIDCLRSNNFNEEEIETYLNDIIYEYQKGGINYVKSMASMFSHIIIETEEN